MTDIFITNVFLSDLMWGIILGIAFALLDMALPNWS